MAIGLSVARIIAIAINLSPVAAQAPNLQSLLVMGDSAVIDTTSRIRFYSTLNAVALDFGTAAPEYLAAVRFFGQNPQPTQLFVGKWASTATAGSLIGTALGSAQMLANFNGVTNGGFNITVDGTARQITGLNFSSATNLNAVASIINAALTQATTVWNGSAFVVTSKTTGTSSSVSVATAGTGSDVSALLGLTATQGARAVGGIAPESYLAGLQAVTAANPSWYGVVNSSTVVPATSDYLAVSAYVEGLSTPHMHGVTSADPNTLLPTTTTSVAYLTKQAGYNRTFVQYSSTDPNAAASFFGRLLTVNFFAAGSAITMDFKQEPGVIAETLGDTAANSILGFNANAMFNYANGTAIVQNGTMASGQYADTVYGVDWLSTNIQAAIFNALYTSNKVPQTDAGVNMLLNVAEAVCAQGVVNGLLAPGVWNSNGFGSLNTGDFMPKGYYGYAPPIATQTQASRAARAAPPLSIAVKLAGAIHTANVVINVNQ